MRYYYDTEFLDDGKTIELISIGIVAEDGREYYAIDTTAPWSQIGGHEWLSANVLPHVARAPQECWKPKSQIRDEVKAFLLDDLRPGNFPELWAWFAAYDHVVLSQLFGRMLDMPAGIPQFTNDVRSLVDWANVRRLPAQVGTAHDALEDARHVKAMHDWIAENRTRP